MNKHQLILLEMKLNDFLYNLDPFNTSCVANSNYDEYESESKEIIKSIGVYINATIEYELHSVLHGISWAIRYIMNRKFFPLKLTQDDEQKILKFIHENLEVKYDNIYW